MEQLTLRSANFTNISTSAYPPSWTSNALAPAVVLSLCFLVGFPGNLAVIFSKPNWQKLSRLTQCLMMNLAMSDLLCLVTLPLWIYTLLYSWTLVVVTCKILSFFMYCSIYCSLLTVTSLSIQRYVQIVHQQRCLQFKKRLLVLLWLIAMVLSIPALVLQQTIEEQQWNYCEQTYTSPAQQLAVLLTEVLVGFSAFSATACAYICLNRRLNQTVFFNNLSTSKLITSIIVTFFVVWMPYLISDLVLAAAILQNNLARIEFLKNRQRIFGAIIFINSSLNPILYAFAFGRCEKMKKAIRRNNEENTVSNVTIS